MLITRLIIGLFLKKWETFIVPASLFIFIVWVWTGDIHPGKEFVISVSSDSLIKIKLLGLMKQSEIVVKPYISHFAFDYRIQ